jgi:hypothetical protein
MVATQTSHRVGEGAVPGIGGMETDQVDHAGRGNPTVTYSSPSRIKEAEARAGLEGGPPVGLLMPTSDGRL